MNDSFLTPDPDFYSIIEKNITEKKTGKIHFYQKDLSIDDAVGGISNLISKNEGDFILVGDKEIRIDTIITLFGRPGPAYEEYDSYANACLACENTI